MHVSSTFSGSCSIFHQFRYCISVHAVVLLSWLVVVHSMCNTRISIVSRGGKCSLVFVQLLTRGLWELGSGQRSNSLYWTIFENWNFWWLSLVDLFLQVVCKFTWCQVFFSLLKFHCIHRCYESIKFSPSQDFEVWNSNLESPWMVLGKNCKYKCVIALVTRSLHNVANQFILLLNDTKRNCVYIKTATVDIGGTCWLC